MFSENEISTAINSLFLELSDSYSLALSKERFFKAYPGLIFRQVQEQFFEFECKPVLRFDNKDALLHFLEREALLAQRFQEYEQQEFIQEQQEEYLGKTDLEDFYFCYNIENTPEGILIQYSTNSLIFKYDVID